MKTLNKSIEYYVYVLEGGKKINIVDIILPKNKDSKKILLEILNKHNLKYDGIDMIYPVVVGDNYNGF